MLEGLQTGEQGEPRECARTIVAEGATRLRMMQAGHTSGYRDQSSKPKKDR